MSEAEWERTTASGCRTAEDRAYVTLMPPVIEPGKIANWIAPPARGINGHRPTSSTSASTERKNARVRVVTSKALGLTLGMHLHGMIAPGGELVVVAGQVGRTGPGSRSAPATWWPRPARHFENVRAVLEAAGSRVRETGPLPDLPRPRGRHRGLHAGAEGPVPPRYFPDGVYPPNTILVVSRLVLPELLAEIEAMAVKPAGSTAKARVSRLPAAKPARRKRATGRRPAGRKRG